MTLNEFLKVFLKITPHHVPLDVQIKSPDHEMKFLSCYSFQNFVSYKTVLLPKKIIGNFYSLTCIISITNRSAVCVCVYFILKFQYAIHVSKVHFEHHMA